MKVYFLILALLVSTKAFGHGENKPGPNGGFIQMPGTFHTEVVPSQKDSTLQIFLLDLGFKNPMTKNSSVEVYSEQSGNKKINFKCEVMTEDHYNCSADKGYNNQSGKLIVKAKRDTATGTSTYKLPLSWTETTPSSHHNMDHSKH